MISPSKDENVDGTGRFTCGPVQRTRPMTYHTGGRNESRRARDADRASSLFQAICTLVSLHRCSSSLSSGYFPFARIGMIAVARVVHRASSSRTRRDVAGLGDNRKGWLIISSRVTFCERLIERTIQAGQFPHDKGKHCHEKRKANSPQCWRHSMKKATRMDVHNDKDDHKDGKQWWKDIHGFTSFLPLCNVICF